MAGSMFVTALVAFGLFGNAVAAEERLAAEGRPGIVQPFTFEAAPGRPLATVVLFPGRDGLVSGLGANFLLRVRGQLAAAGMNVAVVDVPSSHPSGMGPPFRNSPAHARDVGAVLDMVWARSTVPIWLVGTSWGSVSAANAAARLGPGRVAGVVLTSSVWEGLPLDRLAVPTLLVHNRDDGCEESSFEGLAPAMHRLGRSPAVEFAPVSGGIRQGPACGAHSPHGFYGVEGAALGPMLAFIRAHSRR